MHACSKEDLMQTGSAKDSPSEVILGSLRVHIATPEPPVEHLCVHALRQEDAPPMSLYTLKQLLNDCSTRMPRTKCAADKKRETLEDIWRAFNDWIQSRFDMGKVRLLGYRWRYLLILNHGLTWETCTNSRNQPKMRPVFLLSDTFIKTYGLQQRKSLTPPVLASLEEINFTKIANKFSRSLTKDLVFSGVRDLLQRIGEVAGTGAALSIAFNFGRLIAKNRCVSMVFDPMKFPRALEDEIARSMLGSPPSLLGNLEDELQMHDLLLSPGCDRETPVMESAFKRHVSTLAEEVDLEAKYAHDVQLQQRRDVETVALENKMRRMCAEDMQRHLQQQMEHRRKARSSERNEQKMVDPSASSFYCDGEQTRLGYDDKEYLQKNKMDLKEQLLGQISSKAQERVSNSEKNLLDDKVFLRRLRDVMDSIKQKQLQDRDELRKSLTETWRRDATMKKLFETKKKQRAAEQIHRDVVAPGKGGAYYEGYCPHLPQPSTLRFNMMAANTEFSVGFGIRSVCD